MNTTSTHAPTKEEDDTGNALRPKPTSNKDEDTSSSIVKNDKSVGPLYPCGACKELLGRHRFQKKIFRQWAKETSGSNALAAAAALVCQQCKREETAKRCKQAPPKAVRYGRIADSGTKRRPNNFGYCDYVDKVFAMDCFATEIAPLKVFRSAKDVSESMAALQAIRRHGSVEQNTKDGDRVLILCIGDGCTPRTAVLVSFLTKDTEAWECVSIDPALSDDWKGTAPKGVKGLCGYQGTLEEFLKDPHRPPVPQQQQQQQPTAPSESQKPFWRHLVLVCVHSHARFTEDASIDRIRYLYSSTFNSNSNNSSTIRRIPPTTIVSLPCCPTFRHVRDIGEPPHVKYDDDCVFSACRSVEVWNFLEEEYADDPGTTMTNRIPGVPADGTFCTVIPQS